MEPVYFHHSPDIAPLFAVLLSMLIVFIVLVLIAIKLLIFCKIFSKAGYSWVLGLLIIIPIANVIMAFFLAFADWPVLRELRRLKQQQNKPQI